MHGLLKTEVNSCRSYCNFASFITSAFFSTCGCVLHNLPLRLEYLRVSWFNKQSGLYLSLSPLYCVRSFVHHNRSKHSTQITMLTSFIAATSKRLDYVCPAANRTWKRLTIISCDLTHERDTYFLNISHIIYLNYYLPRINRLHSKPQRLIKTNLVNSIIRHRMWLHA